MKLYWWTKAKRAQNVNDYESWISGGVTPTLNAMDNNGEAFATVLICAVDFYNASISDTSQTIRSHTATAVNIGGVLIIDGTRVDDVRVYEDGIVPTVISRYGTGGGNVPMIFEEQPIAYSLREDAKANNFSATETDVALAVQALQPSPQSHHAQLFIAQVSEAVALDTYNQTVNDKTTQAIRASASDVDHIGAVANEAVVRRLTPTECERLQGFPDGWTDGQADSNRYKQMGNAVAVPVVEWIISRMVAE